MNDVSKDSPNILWICTDQQRYDTIGALGNPHGKTPNLDRLVAEGVAFTRAYSQSSIHACTNGNDYWADAAPLVTKSLADRGYDCGLAGKLHLSAAQGRIEKRPDDGYRVFHWSHHPADDWPAGHDYADWIHGKGFDLGAVSGHLEDIPEELHQTTWCADRAIDFIKENREGPWLFSVNPFDPHVPFDPPTEIMNRWNPTEMPAPLFRESDIDSQAALSVVDFQTVTRRPEEFDAKRVKAAYYAMIELIDTNVGRMLDALEESGQRERTVVIFASDHGDALVELRDLAPTVLELAGLLTGELPADRHRDLVRSEYFRTLSPSDENGFEGSYATMIRNDRYKLVVYHGHEIGELFDLHKNPGEFDNLWNDPAHRETRLSPMQRSFDELARAIDIGPKQVAWF